MKRDYPNGNAFQISTAIQDELHTVNILHFNYVFEQLYLVRGNGFPTICNLFYLYWLSAAGRIVSVCEGGKITEQFFAKYDRRLFHRNTNIITRYNINLMVCF